MAHRVALYVGKRPSRPNASEAESACLDNMSLPFRSRFETVLPLRSMRRRRNLHRGDLVFGTIRRPVAVFGSYNIGTGFGVVESSVNNARLHSRRYLRAQRDVALSARQRY